MWRKARSTAIKILQVFYAVGQLVYKVQRTAFALVDHPIHRVPPLLSHTLELLVVISWVVAVKAVRSLVEAWFLYQVH